MIEGHANMEGHLAPGKPQIKIDPSIVDVNEFNEKGANSAPWLVISADHCAPPAHWLMNASTSSLRQAVMHVPILNGLGNFPSRTQRQMVAGLTGRRPGLVGVVAMSATRMMRDAI